MNVEKLYEQATEVSGLVLQYVQDVKALDYFYGPMGRENSMVKSPEQLQRLLTLGISYLEQLESVDFDNTSIYGQVDYIVLKHKIENDLSVWRSEENCQEKIATYIPFASAIYDFEKKRRRGAGVEGQAIAATLNDAYKEAVKAMETFNAIPKMDRQTIKYLLNTLTDLSERLKSSFDFYNAYDPLFSWWVPAPYKSLQSALEEYENVVKEKFHRMVFDDGSGIGGTPVGKDELNRLLKNAMVDYNYEDLLRLADQEMAWCKRHVMEATLKMGFGADWKAAMESLKDKYVPPGKQPEKVVEIYQETLQFIKEKELIAIPELADETWGMLMMSPERQLVNPFFFGGREITISYPVSSMSHEDKLMSMRGNNPYFSRPTVQHELIPGHHLQFFMNSRYKSYREAAFSSAFSIEGWTLYWEMLLFKEGFFKSPEEVMGAMFWRMHRCARITFSVKYHIGEWTPRQCVDYLVQEVGHEYANAHAEVKRSFEEEEYGPLYQLAYLTGGLQLMRIHHELVDSGKMTNIEFHDRVIKENHLPMEMMRATLINQKLNRDYKTCWKFYAFEEQDLRNA